MVVGKRIVEKERRITRGLVSGGALSRGTLCRNLEVLLPSEPLRNPARRQAPDTLWASSCVCVVEGVSPRKENATKMYRGQTRKEWKIIINLNSK